MDCFNLFYLFRLVSLKGNLTFVNVISVLITFTPRTGWTLSSSTGGAGVKDLAQWHHNLVDDQPKLLPQALGSGDVPVTSSLL